MNGLNARAVVSESCMNCENERKFGEMRYLLTFIREGKRSRCVK